MSAMIPHHSLAITRSERAELVDVRVCDLAVEISEAQRREIFEMDWLIEEHQAQRACHDGRGGGGPPVPDYQESAERQCPAD